MFTVSRQRIPWIAGACLSVLFILFSFKYFPLAIPIVNLKLTMDRTEALQKAAAIADTQHLGPIGYSQTTSFEGDNLVKTFVELKGGGSTAFNTMVTGSLYAPYTWQTRHFKEFETNELTVLFKPDGTPYGFIEKIAEQAPGPSLDAPAAEEIARRVAAADWHINFDEYVRVEQSKKTQPNGRTDHMFVYERPNDLIGKEGRYRLRIVVTGDKVSQVTHFVKVPESFQHTYQEMRSSNQTLASAAVIAMYLLYFLGIGLFGLIFLQRRRWIKWRMALIVGGIMALLQAAASLSNYPLVWTYYNTTTPIRGFILQYLLSTIMNSTQTFVLITGTVAIAEGLTRKAFGSHPQLWKIWTKEGGSSYQVLGRTIAGYLLATFDLAFLVTFYLLTIKFLGWWQPSEQLYDPNVLACYAPWLNAFFPSLHAGLWEECLCRAFPLAAAALLAQRYGKRNWWMVGAFILQACIFGAVHANYPAQPAYARLVELGLVSCMSGYVYLRYGLLPCIINHYMYDLILYSLPIFISTAAYAWINESLVLIVGALPLLILIMRRMQTGYFHALTQNLYNQAWQPADTPQEERKNTEINITPHLSARQKYSAMLMLAVGVLLLIPALRKKTDVPALLLSRQQTLNKAELTLASCTEKTPHKWHAFSSVRTFKNGNHAHLDYQHRYIWQVEGKAIYEQLLFSYLSPAEWNVHFIHHTGSIEERAEEYMLHVDLHDKVNRITHKLPQDFPGKTLTEEEARLIARQALQEHFSLTPEVAKEISATSEKHPNRLDWTFTFADTRYQLKNEAQARTNIDISGDQVTDYHQFIHVPETWIRAQNTQQSIFTLYSLAAMFLFFLILAFCIFMLARQVKTFAVSKKWLLALFGILALLQVSSIILCWPDIASHFNAQEPYNQQLFRALAGALVSLIFMVLALSYGCTLIWGTIKQLPGKRDRLLPLVGTALGIFSAGLLAYARSGQHTLEPFWPDCSFLNSYSPFLGTVIAVGMQYLFQIVLIGLLVYALAILFRKKTDLWFQIFVLSLVGCIIAGATLTTPTSWYLLLLQTGAFVLIFNACFYVLRNALLPVLPIIFATVISIGCIQKVLINTDPQIWTGNLCAALLIMSLAYGWWHVQKKKE